MDSAAVLVTMPQAWGRNTSYTASPLSYVDSTGSSSSHQYHPHHQQGARSTTQHTTLSSQVGIGLSDMQHLSTVSSAATSSFTSSISASADMSLSWGAQATSAEVAMPGSQLPVEAPDVSSRRDSYRDQQQVPAAATVVPALPRYASSHQRAAVPIPVTPSPTTRSRSTGSSSSSSGSPMRFQRPQRHSSSAGGFFSATASHLLGALSGISLISSSPTGNASSSSTSSSSGGGSFTGRRATGVRPSPFGSRPDLRGSLLVRAPALLDLDPSESYDDLLALDQFSVKRAVRPAALAALPARTPTAEDQQQQRQCLICLEHWQQQQGQQQEVWCSKQGSKAAAAACGVCSRCVCCVVKQSAACEGNTVHGVHAASVTSADTAASAVSGQQQPEAGSVGLQACSEPNMDSPFALAAATAGIDDAAGWSFSNSCNCRSCDVNSLTATKAAVPIGTGSSSCSGRDLSNLQQERQQYDVVIEQLPCGHEFCSGCIVTWLREHATCPVCRWTFPEELTELINMDS